MTSIWCGQRVRLRAIEPSDWPLFQRLDEDSDTARNTDQIHPPRSTEAHQRWAAEQALQVPREDVFRLAIEAHDSGEPVGTLNTVAPDTRAGRFGYGIALSSEHRRRGYASEAIMLLLAFMFGERRYHKCEIGIYGFNHASLRLHHRLGFTEEGRRRDHEFFAGRHHDLVLMGITSSEFEPPAPCPVATPPGSDPAAL